MDPEDFKYEIWKRIQELRSEQQGRELPTNREAFDLVSSFWPVLDEVYLSAGV